MNPSEERVSSLSSWSMDLKDGGVMSTLVGTAFYMAPELLSGKRIAPTEVCRNLQNSIDQPNG